MSTKLAIASILLYLVTLAVLGFGAVYSFSRKIMSYHEDFLGKPFDQLDPKVGQLLLTLMHLAGATFFAIGFGLLILITGPFRQGDPWAAGAIIVILLVGLVPVLLLTLRIGRTTPWRPVLALIILVVIAAALVLLPG